MTFKKKTIISLCAIIGSLALATTVVVGIFAISNVKIKTNMSVTYTSNHVGAVYSFAYSIYGGSYTYIEKDVDISSLETPTVSTSEITNDYTQLSQEKNYCTLHWSFKNTASNTISATLTYQDTEIGDVGLKIYKSQSSTNVTVDTKLGNQEYFSNITIAPGKTGVFYVKIALDKNAQYAEMSGNFSWTLAVAESA